MHLFPVIWIDLSKIWQLTQWDLQSVENCIPIQLVRLRLLFHWLGWLEQVPPQPSWQLLIGTAHESWRNVRMNSGGPTPKNLVCAQWTQMSCVIGSFSPKLSEGPSWFMTSCNKQLWITKFRPQLLGLPHLLLLRLPHHAVLHWQHARMSKNGNCTWNPRPRCQIDKKPLGVSWVCHIRLGTSSAQPKEPRVPLAPHDSLVNPPLCVPSISMRDAEILSPACWGEAASGFFSSTGSAAWVGPSTSISTRIHAQRSAAPITF